MIRGSAFSELTTEYTECTEQEEKTVQDRTVSIDSKDSLDSPNWKDSMNYAAAGKTSFLLNNPALINETMMPTGKISTIAIAKNNNGFSNSRCMRSI